MSGKILKGVISLVKTATEDRCNAAAAKRARSSRSRSSSSTSRSRSRSPSNDEPSWYGYGPGAVAITVDTALKLLRPGTYLELATEGNRKLAVQVMHASPYTGGGILLGAHYRGSDSVLIAEGIRELLHQPGDIAFYHLCGSAHGSCTAFEDTFQGGALLHTDLWRVRDIAELELLHWFDARVHAAPASEVVDGADLVPGAELTDDGVAPVGAGAADPLATKVTQLRELFQQLRQP
jgi:hypothetical protein